MKILPLLFISSVAANGALLLVLQSTPSPRSAPDMDMLLPYMAAQSPGGTAQVRVNRDTGSIVVVHGVNTVEGSTWNALHSDNLAIFVARMRAAGFPPRVVHAVVISVVNERFVSQREDLIGNTQPDAPFWKPAVSAFNDPEKIAALNKLDRERNDLLRQLLGPDAPLGDELQEVYLRRQYGELPPEKMRRLHDLLRDYRDLRTQLQPPNEPVTTVELEKLAALDREMRANLVKLLTPQELEQYDLRSSATASQLRQRLDVFRPNENEYRAIFQLIRATEERFPVMGDELDPQQMAARRAAESQLESQLKVTLGERYADYHQATSPDYRTLNQIVSRFDLPISSAREVIALKRDLTNRARVLSSNDAIPPAERDAQLRALSDEAFTKLSAALTPRGLEAYKQYEGEWLAVLSIQAEAER